MYRSIEEKNILVEVKKESTKLNKRLQNLEDILYENKGKAVVFKEFFESIANVEAGQLKIEMAVDQKLALINERIDQSNNKADDFKQELEKYEQQFELLRKDQSNVREELVNYKEKGML